jgi:hypothetical protein
MRTKILSGLFGGAIVVIAIVLLNHYPARETAVQVLIWSLLVLFAVMGPYWKHYREGWFWRNSLTAMAIHSVYVVGFVHILPFSTLGVAILMSVPEGIVLIFIIAVFGNAGR